MSKLIQTEIVKALNTFDILIEQLSTIKELGCKSASLSKHYKKFWQLYTDIVIRQDDLLAILIPKTTDPQFEEFFSKVYDVEPEDIIIRLHGLSTSKGFKSRHTIRKDVRKYLKKEEGFENENDI